MQSRRFSTVRHQFNCNRFKGADSQIGYISHWLELHDTERYYAYFYKIDLEKKTREKSSRSPIPVDQLRTVPENIPLQSMVELPDPRLTLVFREGHNNNEIWHELKVGNNCSKIKEDHKIKYSHNSRKQ